MFNPAIDRALKLFSPVGLGDIDSIRFMNRIDTKYIFSADMLPVLLKHLSESYKILEIEGVRAFPYQSKYLDSDCFYFYNQHVTGKLSRYKVRYRKYLATGNSFLEVKRKNNRNSTSKWRIESDFEQDNLNNDGLIFLKNYIRDIGFDLHIVLYNKFTRITLAGINSRERITLDFAISFSSNGSQSVELPFLAIAELKSEGVPRQTAFKGVVRELGIKITGFSKYCIGIALLNDVPKKNILKPKILLLKKIEYEYFKSCGS
jgi:hypothetical protein